jgi:DNA-binding response OmpR family regulator
MCLCIAIFVEGRSMQTLGYILVVDDDPPIVEFIAELLTDEGYRVCTALTPADARAAIAKRRPDLVLLDLHMPGISGYVLAHDLRSDGLADVPIIMMTADANTTSNLSMDDIAFCLLKPFDLDDLLNCVAKHMRREISAA